MIERNVFGSINKINDPTLRRSVHAIARTVFDNWFFILVVILLWRSPYIIADLTDSVVKPTRFVRAGESANWQSVMAQAMVLACLSMSYNLLFGYSGVISFGHALFFGAGAYTTFIMLQHYNPAHRDEVLIVVNLAVLLLAIFSKMPLRRLFIVFLAANLLVLILLPASSNIAFLQAAGVAVLVSVALSLLSGAVTLRLRGVYFAMFTLALAEVFFVVARSGALIDYTGAEDGLLVGRLGLIPEALDVVPRPKGGEPLANRLNTFYLTLVFFVIVFLAIRRYLNSPVGRVMLAIRENEERARTIGYNTFYFKLMTMAFAGAIAGMSGLLFVLWDSFKQVRPEYLSLDYTVTPLLYTLIGGVGTLTGPVLSTIGLGLGESYLRDESVELQLIGSITIWQVFVIIYLMILAGIIYVLVRKIVLPWYNRTTNRQLGQSAPSSPAWETVRRYRLVPLVSIVIIPGVLGLALADRLLGDEAYKVSEIWDLLLGTLFVLTVLVLPNGIVGTWNKWQAERRLRRLQARLDANAATDN